MQKTYYTNIPNSSVVVQRGPGSAERVQFFDDKLVVDSEADPQLAEYLETVVNRSGSPITTKADHKDQDAAIAAESVKKLAIEHLTKIAQSKMG